MIIDNFEAKYIPKQRVSVESYERANGHTVVLVFNIRDELLCVTTANLPQAEVPEGHVTIKDYDENTGVLGALIKAKIVGKPIAEVPTGSVFAQVCPLLIKEGE